MGDRAIFTDPFPAISDLRAIADGEIDHRPTREISRYISSQSAFCDDAIAAFLASRI